jgi:hypothetical protein
MVTQTQRLENPLLAAALDYAAFGWRVVPNHHLENGQCSCGKQPGKCNPGKHPRYRKDDLPNGISDGTTDAGLITRWWQRWPKANIGICTGKDSGIWVLGPDGPEGIEALAELVHHYGALPRTPTAKSGSDGRHYVFRWPASGGIINAQNHRDVPIDIRGEGGQFIAAPSRNKNGAYIWEIGPDECELADAPDWLPDWCRAKKKSASSLRGKAVGPTSIEERAVKYLAKIPPAISGQGGHPQTMKAARIVVYGFALGADAGFRILWEHFNPRCEPPWTEKELRHKCADADTKPYWEPRGWLLANDKKHESNGHSSKGVEKPPTPELWDDPLPLGEVPEVDPFPLDVLPAPARRLVEEIAWAMNCAPDLAGLALLTLAGGAIANGRHLAITETHTVSPCLYAVVVAPPGMAKSPPLRLLRRPFDLTETQNRKAWKRALETWKESDKEDRGPKPILKRCQVSNITTESLQIILDENPRGVLMIRNEMSGLIAGLNQYKNGGDDRQFYLDLWDGTPIITDRKSDRLRDGAPVCVMDAFTSIYGTIQPDVIAIMRADAGRRRAANDGFLDRFLFAYPRDLPAVGEQWRAVSAGARAAWEYAIKELLSLRMKEENDKPPRPVMLKLTADGAAAWQRFTERMAAELNQEDFPDHLRGPWAKLRAYGARLALILRCLRWACQTEGGDSLDEVDGESMDGAARLVDYFKSHARKVYAMIDADPRHREGKRALRWLANSLNSLKCLKGSRVVSKSELHAGVWGGSKDVEEMGEIIRLLVRYGWLRLLLEEEKKGPGRRASPHYEVHPFVFKTPSENSDFSENCSREPGEEG